MGNKRTYLQISVQYFPPVDILQRVTNLDKPVQYLLQSANKQTDGYTTDKHGQTWVHLKENWLIKFEMCSLAKCIYIYICMSLAHPKVYRFCTCRDYYAQHDNNYLIWDHTHTLTVSSILLSSFFADLIWAAKSPDSQYTMTMCKCSAESKLSIYRTVTIGFDKTPRKMT